MTSALSYSHNAQKDIHNVVERSPSDDALFREVAEVLLKHGAEKRFGIALLHKHFDLAPGEVIVEQTDVAQRLLVSSVMKETDISKASVVEVLWELSGDNLVGACRGRCNKDDWNGHVYHHTAESYAHLPLPVNGRKHEKLEQC